ncbi:MAG: site-specific integrase [Planctomycetes bacterium]|nr:site-specific integrase [Planctomycetota bacterium]
MVHDLYHRIQAARRFTLWLFKQKRVLSTHPLADLQPFNAGEDQRRRRRALLADELVRLLTETEIGPRRSGFTGRERALIYRLALESGLRRNELRTLRWSNIDLVAGLITIDARNSKHREEDELPLRRRTAAILVAWREHCGNPSSTSHVFTQAARWCDTHLFIRRDLEAASIPAETPDGRIDFHSLRVSFVTALARGGVHPRKAMQLARHSSIDLTMRVYTKLQTTELASCLDVLPDTPDAATAAKAG